MSNLKFVRLKRKIWLCLSIFTIFNLSVVHQSTIKATEIKGENTNAYKPRPGRKRTQARKPGGYRGDSCSQKSQDPVTLLVPQDHIPLTTSAHPAFFWNVNTISHPIRFTLYEPGQSSPTYVQNITPTAPGIVALSLPKTVESLKIGVQYRWTVSVICNSKRPSENIYAKAWIERVERSKSFDDKLSCSPYYAQLGIWYDALFCQAQSTQEFWSLLNQVQLSAIAQKQPQIKFIN